MKIYLSAGFGGVLEVRKLADQLRAQGIEVTSNWLYEPPVIVSPSRMDWELRARANEDLEDIRRSDMVVVLEQWPSTSGGKFVELGYALGLNKRIALVGEKSCVFHFRAEIEHYDTWEDFLASLAVAVAA